jgi:hypothetical protein
VNEEWQALADRIPETVKRMEDVAGDLSDGQLNWSPGSGQWSVGQCIQHLNASNAAYMDRIEAVVEDLQKDNRKRTRPAKLGFLLKMLVKSFEPPYKMKVKTTAPFQPKQNLQKDAVIEGFRESHDRMLRIIAEMDDLEDGAKKMTSPFMSLAKFTPFQAVSILSAHDRRHLWQAEQVRRRGGF